MGQPRDDAIGETAARKKKQKTQNISRIDFDVNDHESRAPTPQHKSKLWLLAERDIWMKPRPVNIKAAPILFFFSPSVDLRRQADFLLLFTGTF